MKKRILRFLKNKYATAVTIFLLWICFFNDIDLFFIVQSRWELMNMRKEVKELRKQNQLAKEALNDISNNTASLEKFARETYYMKRDNEDVYVFKERAD
jgi:cell division protein FtsB